MGLHWIRNLIDCLMGGVDGDEGEIESAIKLKMGALRSLPKERLINLCGDLLATVGTRLKDGDLEIIEASIRDILDEGPGLDDLARRKLEGRE